METEKEVMAESGPVYDQLVERYGEKKAQIILYTWLWPELTK